MKPHASLREANAPTFPPLTPALSPLRGEGASRRRMFSNCPTFHYAGKKTWVMISDQPPTTFWAPFRLLRPSIPTVRLPCVESPRAPHSFARQPERWPESSRRPQHAETSGRQSSNETHLGRVPEADGTRCFRPHQCKM